MNSTPVKIICRTCLNNDKKSLKSVFDFEYVDSKMLSVSELLLECTSIQITTDDLLPKSICKSCTEQVKSSYVFKKRCYEAERTLSLRYKNIIKDDFNDNVASGDSNDIDYDVNDSKFDTSSDNINVTETCIQLPNCEDNTTEKIFDKLNDEKKHYNDACEDDSFIESSEKIAWNCTMCEKTFIKKHELAKHKSEHTEYKHKCNICSKFYLAEWGLRNHLMTHKHSCKVCFLEFESKELLEKHKLEHKNHMPFVCKECGKQFARKRNLYLHLKIHTGEKNYVCTVCGRAFTLAGNLNAHLRIHNGVKPYSCKLCGKAFLHRITLESHNIINHSKGERPHVCQTCGNAYPRRQSLVIHMRRHTGDRPYACNYCEKRFVQLNELNDHILKHTGERKHTCEFCGKAFGRKSTLSMHKKIHTGERPHVCSVCGKGFIQRHVLSSHMNTHNK